MSHRPRTPLRHRLVAAVAVLAAAAVPALVAAPAQAATGSLLVEGRGYGHGRGMSQWGAYGAADAGLDWTQILAFYYPGTARAATGTGQVRVLLSADTGADVHVQATPGLALRSGGQTAALTTGSHYDAWRLVRSGPGAGPVLQRLDAGVWTTVTPPVPISGDTGFVVPGGIVRVVLPAGAATGYRGEVRAVPEGTTGLRSVAVLDLESYLRGVVPAEMPASWHEQALRAQSVAARSYAARLRAANAAKTWDLCDTTACQVFKGAGTYAADGTLLVSAEHPRTDAAIAATAATVLTWTSGGTTSVAFTEFSAANGGATAAGSVPYQVAKVDPYDGRIPSTAHAWTTSVPVATIERAYPTTGSFRSVTVLARNGVGEWGGRATSVRVSGSSGSVTVTGDALRSALGLKSAWIRTGVAPHPRDLSRDGYADVLAVTTAGRLTLSPGWTPGAAQELGAATEIGRGWSAMRLLTQVGDWNGDGAADVVASGADGRLLLYPGVAGTSGTTLGSPVTIGKGWTTISALVGIGDLDGDGAVDLVARRSSDQTLWLYRGDGRGAVAGAVYLGRGWGGVDLVTAVGDLDQDGRPDLLVRSVGTGALLLYRGRPGGALAAGTTVGTRAGSLAALSGPGDLGGDGTGDVVAVDSTGTLRRYAWNGAVLTGAGTLGPGWTGVRLVG